MMMVITAIDHFSRCENYKKNYVFFLCAYLTVAVKIYIHSRVLGFEILTQISFPSLTGDIYKINVS